jgi:hypothetical protein
MDFDGAAAPLLIFIIAFNIIMPFVGGLLDRSSFESLTNPDKQTSISKQFLRQVALKKTLPYEFVLYQRPNLEIYNGLKTLHFSTMFCLFTSQLHPLISFFKRFDVEYKRLARFMVLSFQLSLIAVISSAVFSLKVYRGLRDY